MTNIKHKRIKVASLGSLDISLPMLELGKGNPKVLILAGLHGDEHTGLFVIQRLINRIKLTKGTLRIIPFSDPLAQVLNRREEPLSRKDPNRAFPGDDKGDFTERLVSILFAQAKKCPECVIDLHTLGMHSRLMTIFMNHGTYAVRERSLELITAFSPDLIWQLDTTSLLGRSWGGSMGPTMAKEGIVNFAVEMANHDHVTDEEINRTVDGIKRVLHHLGMSLATPKSPTHSPLMFAYRSVKSDDTGLFEPSPELLKAVRSGNFPPIAKNQRIGRLINPVTFELIEIRSKHDGPLIAISGRAFIRSGDDLYNVGEVKPWTMLADSTVSMAAKYAQAMQPEAAKGLEKLVEIVETLATEKRADASICKMALWLSSVDKDTDPNSRLANSFLSALDVDKETIQRILDCMNTEGNTPEATVIRQAKY